MQLTVADILCFRLAPTAETYRELGQRFEGQLGALQPSPSFWFFHRPASCPKPNQFQLAPECRSAPPYIY